MVLYTKEEALKIVNNYVTDSIRFEDGRFIFNLIILIDDPHVSKIN